MAFIIPYMNAPIAPNMAPSPARKNPPKIITIKMIARIKKVINSLMGKKLLHETIFFDISRSPNTRNLLFK